MCALRSTSTKILDSRNSRELKFVQRYFFTCTKYILKIYMKWDFPNALSHAAFARLKSRFYNFLKNITHLAPHAPKSRFFNFYEFSRTSVRTPQNLVFWIITAQSRREVFSVITYFEKQKTQKFRAPSALQHAAGKIHVFLDHTVSLYMFCTHFKLLAPQAIFLD